MLGVSVCEKMGIVVCGLSWIRPLVLAGNVMFLHKFVGRLEVQEDATVVLFEGGSSLHIWCHAWSATIYGPGSSPLLLDFIPYTGRGRAREVRPLILRDLVLRS